MSMEILVCNDSSPNYFDKAQITKSQLMYKIIGEGAYSQVWETDSIFRTRSVVKFNSRNIPTPGFENIKELDILLKVRGHPCFVQLSSVINFNLEETIKFEDSEVSDDFHFVLKQETCRINNISPVMLSDSGIIRYSYQLFSAINFLHSNRIIHGDIKPANILYRKNDDQIVLADFGISCYRDNLFPQRIKTLYSKHFIPPEYDGSFVRVAEAGDIYACGKVIQLLVVQSLGELTSSRLYSLVKKCLKKSPKERPSARDALGYSVFDEIRIGYSHSLRAKKVYLNHKFSVPQQDIIADFYNRRNFGYRISFHSFSVVCHMMECLGQHADIDLRDLLETSTCIFVKIFSGLDNFFTEVRKINRERFDDEIEKMIIEEFACNGVVFDCLYEEFTAADSIDDIDDIFHLWVSLDTDTVYSDSSKLLAKLREELFNSSLVDLSTSDDLSS